MDCAASSLLRKEPYVGFFLPCARETGAYAGCRGLRPLPVGVGGSASHRSPIVSPRYLSRTAFSCAVRHSSAALKQWCWVMAISVRLRQSRINSPKKGQPMPSAL